MKWGTTEYAAMHRRLRCELGRANAQLCPCGRMADEWARTGPADALSGYWPMCFSCHRKMDLRSRPPRTMCNHGHVLTPENTVIRKRYRACRTCERNQTGHAWRRRKREERAMSETPIGDQVESEVMPAGMVRGIAPHATSDDAVIAMDDPYRIPGEDDPDEPGEDASEGDELVEPTDNSGEPEAGDEPQEPDAVTDNANELDSDEADDGE